ncbi:hypothetical protein F2Q70_00005742, partial [Brassica cretica]
WRFLDFFTRDYAFVCDGISLKGNNYWVAENEETGFFLMKFDFTTETFNLCVSLFRFRVLILKTLRLCLLLRMKSSRCCIRIFIHGQM